MRKRKLRMSESTSTKVWFLIIDHDCTPMGGLDEVTVPDTLTVAGLRTKIKEKEWHDLGHLDARRLTLFECMDSSINLKDCYQRNLPNQLEKAFSSNAVQQLGSTQVIASLQLQSKTVIVQVPGALHQSACSLPFVLSSSIPLLQIFRKYTSVTMMTTVFLQKSSF